MCILLPVKQLNQIVTACNLFVYCMQKRRKLEPNIIYTCVLVQPITHTAVCFLLPVLFSGFPQGLCSVLGRAGCGGGGLDC